jgi:hypothetical protein
MALVGGCLILAACAARKSSPADASDPGDAGEAGSTCQPVDVDRGACRPPLDTSMCAATWDTRAAPMCGLRIYEGPGAGYLLQYVSYNDIPPIGGPSWMCVYDAASGALAGGWALDHYLRWCCGSSLDMFQGIATNQMVSVAASMATHPACPDAGADATPAPQ